MRYWRGWRIVQLLGVSALSTLLSVSVAGQSDHSSKAAHAIIKDAKGQTIGQAELSNTAQGVLIRLRLTGAPAATHAFHIHGTGKCDPPSFESAGGHFNPLQVPHGFHDSKGMHLGDLPNLHVPQNGALEIEFLAKDVSLENGEHALLDADGAALVIHESADDYHSDPAGNAGGRLACGVIAR
jgi:Cu-Zn family superoxide dismutase